MLPSHRPISRRTLVPNKTTLPNRHPISRHTLVLNKTTLPNSLDSRHTLVLNKTMLPNSLDNPMHLLARTTTLLANHRITPAPVNRNHRITPVPVNRNHRITLTPANRNRKDGMGELSGWMQVRMRRPLRPGARLAQGGCGTWETMRSMRRRVGAGCGTRTGTSLASSRSGWSTSRASCRRT